MDGLNKIPPEILFLILRQLDLFWLCKARLACKAFADAGLRCLVHTVKVARSPASFQRIQFIKDHPVLRFYVKELVYAYDDIGLIQRSYQGKSPEETALLNQIHDDLAEFQAKGQDIAGLKMLIQSFPALQQINLESPFITYGPIVDAGYLRLNSRSQSAVYGLLEPSITCLASAISVIDMIDSLHIDGAPAAIVHFDAPQYFQGLRRLHLSFKEDFQTQNTEESFKKVVPGFFRLPFPLMTHLQIGFDMDGLYREGHLPLSFPLPSTLQVLKLDHMQFPQLRLPPQLRRLKLSNCKLLGADLGGWVDVLAPCTMECQFYGCFTAELSGPVISNGTWLDCRDELLDAEVGSCLAKICSTRCPDNLRKNLLTAIFDPLLTRRFDRVVVDIHIDEQLELEYRQLKRRQFKKRTKKR